MADVPDDKTKGKPESQTAQPADNSERSKQGIAVGPKGDEELKSDTGPKG